MSNKPHDERVAGMVFGDEAISRHREMLDLLDMVEERIESMPIRSAAGLHPALIGLNAARAGVAAMVEHFEPEELPR